MNLYFIKALLNLLFYAYLIFLNIVLNIYNMLLVNCFFNYLFEVKIMRFTTRPTTTASDTIYDRLRFVFDTVVVCREVKFIIFYLCHKTS